MLEFDIENTLVLKHELEELITKIDADWQNVITQWERLSEYWNDQHYDEFEPFLETLFIRYERLLREIDQYNLFLQNKISGAEKIYKPEYVGIREAKWGRYGTGEFTRNKILQLPNDLKGVYYIQAPDITNSQELEITYYIGKTDSSIKDKLFLHLERSDNQNLRKAVISGQALVFYWRESLTPTYEVVLEIRRLKNKSVLMGECHNKKVFIEKLDFD